MNANFVFLRLDVIADVLTRRPDRGKLITV